MSFHFQFAAHVKFRVRHFIIILSFGIIYAVCRRWKEMNFSHFAIEMTNIIMCGSGKWIACLLHNWFIRIGVHRWRRSNRTRSESISAELEMPEIYTRPTAFEKFHLNLTINREKSRPPKRFGFASTARISLQNAHKRAKI